MCVWLTPNAEALLSKNIIRSIIIIIMQYTLQASVT